MRTLKIQQAPTDTRPLQELLVAAQEIFGGEIKGDVLHPSKKITKRAGKIFAANYEVGLVYTPEQA